MPLFFLVKDSNRAHLIPVHSDMSNGEFDEKKWREEELPVYRCLMDRKKKKNCVNTDNKNDQNSSCDLISNKNSGILFTPQPAEEWRKMKKRGQ